MTETAAEDAAFVASVGAFMCTDFQQLQRNVEEQIEEYLRKRVAHLQLEAREEQQQLVAASAAAVSQLQATMSRLEAQLAGALEQRSKAGEQLGRQRDLNALAQHWLSWRMHVRRSKERKRVVLVLEAQNNRAVAQRSWWAWRQCAHAGKQQRRHQNALQIRERKLLGEVEQMKTLLAEHERQREAEKEHTTTAFVRGVCALNREAVQVLRGETGEVEAEAIESILRGTPSAHSGQSRSLNDSRPPGKDLPILSSSLPARHDGAAVERERPSLTAGHEGYVEWLNKSSSGTGCSPAGSGVSPAETGSGPGFGSASRRSAPESSPRGSPKPHHDICPVHHVDSDGNFYHKCYAVGRNVLPRQKQAQPHTPFVVRVDPNEGIPVGGSSLPQKKNRF